MFIAVKLMLYLVAAHVFYNNGFSLDSKVFEFVVLMSCFLLIDIVSFFGARHQLLVEMFTEEGD